VLRVLALGSPYTFSYVYLLHPFFPVDISLQLLLGPHVRLHCSASEALAALETKSGIVLNMLLQQGRASLASCICLSGSHSTGCCIRCNIISHLLVRFRDQEVLAWRRNRIIKSITRKLIAVDVFGCSLCKLGVLMNDCLYQH
jgi:hypothetical protein